jgi:hypothetical protein
MDLGREQANAIPQARRVGGGHETLVSRDDMRVVVHSERQIKTIVYRVPDLRCEF